MARYSLRNKHKIKQSLGDIFLNTLILSLNDYFKNSKEIVEYDYQNEKFKVIHVNNIQKNTDSFFELYVLSKTFDVYNLAYKSVIG
jgi:hypothetical protein